MAEPLLQVKNLTVKFNHDKIIDNLSFTVDRGENLTILGPNASGKSVLIKTLLGLIPFEGQINWIYKPKISYLPQNLNQTSAFGIPITLEDFFNLKTVKPQKKELVNFLNLVGLSEKDLPKKINILSSGQFQRMLVAWVLIDKPEVVFLDEPTTSLDIGGGESIYSLLEKIGVEKDLTIFLVTHDLNIVYGFSDKVLCLNRKAHICFGTPFEILTPKNLEETFGMKLKFYKHNK